MYRSRRKTTNSSAATSVDTPIPDCKLAPMR